MTSTLTTVQQTGVRTWLGVATITASLFVFVTTELLPVGLLTPLSAGLSVTVGLAGTVVTLYGVSAGVGVPFIVAWTRRVDRRALLAFLLVVLALGNLVTALAPSFALVLATRLIMGFAHGVFWAIGVSMAVRLVPERHASRAAAVVLSGVSIGAVVGVPLGTLVEGLTDWRTTFLAWSAVSLLVAVAVLVAVPSLPSSDAVRFGEVLRLPLANARLRVVIVIVTLYVLGHFSAFTFIRPVMEQSAAASAGTITVVLIVFGVGGAIGNGVAGYTVGSHLRTTFVIACTGLLGSLLLVLAIGDSLVGMTVSVVLWGLSFGAANLCQVNLILAAAPDRFEAAMSINTMAYNIAIALGALLGGFAATGFGVGAAIWFGAALMAAALLSLLASRRIA